MINGKTIIGDDCTISQFLTIGSNKETPAKISNNVYIGPNVCLVENVVIGDNIKIGAGAVAVKDLPANATAVGNPARIIIKCKNYYQTSRTERCQRQVTRTPNRNL